MNIMSGMRLTFAEIYIKNFEANVKAIKKFVKPGVKICCSVKADAYGHGAVACAKAAVKCGADFLAVATVGEGIELREAKIKAPILLLSYCSPSEMADLVKFNITPFVGDEEYIGFLESAAKKAFKSKTAAGATDGKAKNAANAKLAKNAENCSQDQKAAAKKFSVHLAVDSGMGRVGCLPSDAAALAKRIASSKYLTLGGMCTHFASADGTSARDRSYAKKQRDAFVAAVESVKAAGIKPGIVHASASAALMDKPEWQFDMVRPGIILYGYYPDKITEKYLRAKKTPLVVKPVMALVTGISALRPFKKGMSVSYGSTWTAAKDTTIGVLPIGYADGLLRRQAGSLKVSIGKKLYPVRGRICMDQCMVDLGNAKGIKRFDRAVIFGPKESGALLTADDLAADAGTISYEILTCVGKRVERVYVK